jgi:hypothetical protein
MSKKYKLLNMVLICTILLFSACEKGLDSVEVDNTVYIPNSGVSPQTALLGESIYQLGVYHAGVNQREEQLTVNLGVDEAAFATFLTTNPGYEMLPSTYYSIPNNDVILDKENPRSFLNIHFKNVDESFVNKKYVLPVSIKSVSAEVKINEAKRVTFLTFSRFRNAYESKYKAYGQVKDETAAVVRKIDEVISTTSVSANAIDVTGLETGMKVRLTILNNKVTIRSAPGSETFNVQNNAVAGESTFEGEFDKVYQSNKGTFKLFYTYTLSGKQLQAAVDLSFTL